MNRIDIMAVVVSYNGGERLRRTVSALRGQVGHVHIVDNGSEADSRAIVECFALQSDISISWLPENRGIGAALNVGITRARERGQGWLLTMDQDSTIDEGMIPAYIHAVGSGQSVACLTPRMVVNAVPQGVREKTVDYAITSGNLVRMDVYEKVGTYNERMFIDGVDFDFSLRVREGGFMIEYVREAILIHELGDSHAVPNWLARYHTFHSPVRRYYMTRNFLYMLEQHAVRNPAFMAKMAAAHVIQLFTILLLGKKRIRSYVLMARGVYDYACRKAGPYKGGV